VVLIVELDSNLSEWLGVFVSIAPDLLFNFSSCRDNMALLEEFALVATEAE
jgi:hypothetical protein